VDLQLNLFAIPCETSQIEPSLRRTILPTRSPIADRLEKSANSLQATIDQKINPSISEQRPTPRRQRISDEMRKEGLILQLVQAWLRSIATQHRTNQLNPLFNNFRSRADVEALARVSQLSTASLARAFASKSSNCEKLSALGLKSPELLLEAVSVLNATSSIAEPKIDVTAARLHLEAIWAQAPDYFPTPDDLIAKMIGFAAIEPSDICLEPSAGSGSIALALRAIGVEQIDCVESYRVLRQALELQRFRLVGSDFLEMQPSATYNKILMNPPFGKNVYVQHIQHAYRFLARGGRLVAIAPCGYETATVGAPKKFREWLNTLNFMDFNNGRDAFAVGDRPIKIETKIIVIYKGG
jgi:Methyltransferase small domain